MVDFTWDEKIPFHPLFKNTGEKPVFQKSDFSSRLFKESAPANLLDGTLFFFYFRQLVRQYFLFGVGGGAADCTDSKKHGILYLF
jgi:hypothetical protein